MPKQTPALVLQHGQPVNIEWPSGRWDTADYDDAHWVVFGVEAVALIEAVRLAAQRYVDIPHGDHRDALRAALVALNEPGRRDA